MSRIQTPLRLDRFTGSPARHRMQHAALLMKWALGWLRDTHEMSIDAALEGLAYAKMLRRLAAALERTFEDAAIAEMTHRDLSAYCGQDYAATLRSGATRKGWRHNELLAELIEDTSTRLAAAHPEIDPRLVRHLVTISMREMHSLGRVEWRATDLRRHGLNPGDFSTSVPGRCSINLTGPATFPTLPTGLALAPQRWQDER